MRSLALAALLLCGCTFSRAGVSGHGRDLSPPADRLIVLVESGPGATDRATDRKKLDRELTADRRPPDQAPTHDKEPPADKKAWPDKGLPMPISAAALGNALVTTKVACVKADGSVIANQQIPLADSSGVFFYNGSIALGAAGAATKTWAGAQPSVIVVFDPNACDTWEDPGEPSGSNWATGGLLIRKASLQAGQLLVQAGATVQDLNAMNVNQDGTFQEDYFLPDDSQLSDFPQLVQPISKAKELILLLGNL